MSLFRRHALLRRFLSFAAILSMLAITSAYAQTANHTYDVELVVSNGKKSVETDADITFTDKSLKVVPDKTEFQSSTRVIEYKDIKQADHSYSKKPMLSGGGAIATAVLLGIVALPFLFIKKKKHWLSVQAGEGNFAVIKLGDNNFRQIVAEMQAHGVTVNELKETDK